MEQMTEVWIDVPETDSRFQISNKGHLRRIAKKKRLRKKTVVISEIAPVKMVADYKTGTFGWYVYFDNVKHFLERDKLMRLFVSIPVFLDPMEEKKAIEAREQGFDPYFSGISECAEGRWLNEHRQIVTAGSSNRVPGRQRDVVMPHKARNRA